MNNVFNITMAILYTIIFIIRNPFYWLIILLVYLQYRRIAKMEKKIIGINKESTFVRVLKSSAIGIIGGLMGSFIIIFLGITISVNDFVYIIILAVILMLIHPRFLCFSYAGGIIAVFSLTLGYPKINVPSIMAVVAILHLIESFLIWLDGDTTKVPIFIQRNNRIVGGFNMLKFWPIPFIVLIVQTQTIIQGGLTASDWWPIFKSSHLFSSSENLVFLMAGVIAALGYGDIAVTEFPKKKVRSSAKNLFIYSCILLTLSIFASYYDVFKFIAALFSIIAHEILIQIGRNKELKGNPIFTAPSRGIKILDIIPKSPADKIGLRTGDVILSLNGFTVNSKEDIKQLLFYKPNYITVEYFNKKGILTKKDFNNHNNINGLGVLTVPKSESYHIITEEIKSPLLYLFQKIKDRLFKR